MKKLVKRRGLVVAVMAGLLLTATSLTAFAQGPGYGPGVEAPVSVSEATASDAEGLLFMVEEEKLARDVYMALYEEWDLRVFDNIARSEQAHMDAIRVLLDRYGLADPTVSADRGEFINTELQELYQDLLVSGTTALEDALDVSAAIEEIDILDLEEYVNQTDSVDIQRVYEKLLRGSTNHLRAFASMLEQQTGEVYEPQYLEQEVFDEMMAASGSGQRGAGYRGGGRGVGSNAPGADASGQGGLRGGLNDATSLRGAGQGVCGA